MTQGDSLVLHCASLSHEPVRVQNVRDFPQTKLDSEINASFLLRSFLTFALRILTAHNLWRH